MRYHLTYIHFNFSTFVTSKQIKYLARKHTKHTWFQLANIHSNGCRYFIKWWQSLLIIRSFSSLTSCGFFLLSCSRIQIEMEFNDNGEQLKIIWNYSHSIFFSFKIDRSSSSSLSQLLTWYCSDRKLNQVLTIHKWKKNTQKKRNKKERKKEKKLSVKILQS